MLLVVGLASAACGSTPHRSVGAAEPANSPAITVPPAGTVRNVGLGPEGIVYDPLRDLVAVAVRRPDSLALLNPADLRVRRLVPLPGSVRHLQLAGPGGPVLVPVETANELLQVELPSGRVASATRVGKQPHDATKVGPVVAVANEFGPSISLISAGAVTRTLTGLRQPGGIVGDADTVAVVDVGAFTLSTYDASTGRRSAVVSAGAGPTHAVVLGPNRLAVADTRGNAILVFTISPLAVVARLSLPGAPYGLAADPTTSSLWVTLTGRNEVVGLRSTGAALTEVARYPTARQPNSVAVAPGSRSIWIACSYSGVVEHIVR